ncbi:UDP-forming cellulose synthase catalytic subunit [Phaeobacter italicus]|uniref:UDP-forming cellulose synthase catalytic subunit n=1 Tax=Phaeobacter italicus TaxID=481446 RepID=UPI00242ED24C|nr:UDP-forming cellulose synthase catalytic subunit [Phaeobacter italicus]MCI5101164.1 UDP-forming cellulose synthase catalytic subunit [Phaeobacter italicus]
MNGSILKNSRAVSAPFVVLFLLTAAAAAYLASIPSSIEAQIILSLSAVVIALVLRFATQDRLFRILFLGLASVVALRYWFWRLTSTLPSLDDPVSFGFGVALFAVESYAIALFLLGNFVSIDPIDHPLPSASSSAGLPSVTILVPSLDEGEDILGVTLAACRNIAYPDHLKEVVLCDDGGTDQRIGSPDPRVSETAQTRRAEMQALCSELGVRYFTRAENKGAKAGNLSEAMEATQSELVVIFDADHVPSEDFLARTVGYFEEDPRLFLVQTPHFFLNPDPVARNTRLDAGCPPENEMFYDHIHRGLDRWGGAFFCGSAAVLRREALAEVGGILGRTITEDAETSLDLHARGWTSMYLNRAMVAGLQPETFASLGGQRARWSTGMVQLLMTQNPMFKRGLSWSQRLCYLNSMGFWLFPFARIALLMAPLVYLFFGIELFVTTATEAVSFMGAYILLSYMAQNAVYSRLRWPFISEVYEIATAPYLVRGVLGAIFSPRGQQFQVTAKDEVIENERLSEVYGPLLFLFGLMAAGVVAAVWRWYTVPSDAEVLKIVGAWTVFNFILTAAALRSVVEQRQRRKTPRIDLDADSLVTVPNVSADTAVPARIIDGSLGGLRVSIPLQGEIPALLFELVAGDVITVLPSKTRTLIEPEPIRIKARRITRTGGNLVIGGQFPEDRHNGEYRTIASLLYGDSGRWLQIRDSQREEKGLLGGTVYVIAMAFKGIAATLSNLGDARAATTDQPERVSSRAPASDAEIDLTAFANGTLPGARSNPRSSLSETTRPNSGSAGSFQPAE